MKLENSSLHFIIYVIKVSYSGHSKKEDFNLIFDMFSVEFLS